MARLVTDTHCIDWVVCGNENGAYAYNHELGLLFHPDFRSGEEQGIQVDMGSEWTARANDALERVNELCDTKYPQSAENNIPDQLVKDMFVDHLERTLRPKLWMNNVLGVSYATGELISIWPGIDRIVTEGMTLEEAYRTLAFEWGKACYDAGCGFPWGKMEGLAATERYTFISFDIVTAEKPVREADIKRSVVYRITKPSGNGGGSLLVLERRRDYDYCL